MKAYKVFDKNWQCKGFQYKIGKTYTMKEKPILCEIGFHACKKLVDCFNYYSFDTENKVAEVNILGDIVGDDGEKIATNKIKIVKEIQWSEVLILCNSGDGNSGNRNSGDRNSGNGNSGNWNSGDRNSGNWNSGDRNSGDRNSGNWNSGNWNSGYFNTNNPELKFFNKNIKKKFENIEFPQFLYFELNQWVSHDTATEEERVKYKEEIETCGGFLKFIDYKTAFKRSWSNAPKEDREKVKKLPNFNAKIFFEISGIDVEEDK